MRTRAALRFVLVLLMSQPFSDDRNQMLDAEQADAEVEPLCEVALWCDSATTRVTRLTLLARHGTRRAKKVSGRARCPKCGGKAWWQAAGEPEEDEERGPGVLALLASPFRREESEEVMMELDCTVCAAYRVKYGRGDVCAAGVIVDGNGLCDEHARSMLAVIAGRLPERTGDAE